MSSRNDTCSAFSFEGVQNCDADGGEEEEAARPLGRRHRSLRNAVPAAANAGRRRVGERARASGRGRAKGGEERNEVPPHRSSVRSLESERAVKTKRVMRLYLVSTPQKLCGYLRGSGWHAHNPTPPPPSHTAKAVLRELARAPPLPPLLLLLRRRTDDGRAFRR